ncbi:carbohydrate kinase [Bacteroidota bacterium]|nr:carbohydrate kinase [Bacteroidota bacterium]
MKHLEKLINSKFSKLRIAVIGDVMLDRYLYGSVDRISPEAPVPVVNIQKKEDRPGGAANVAINLKSIGVTPVLFSVIGKDEAGKKLFHLLSNSGIDTSNIISSKLRITTSKTRVLSKNHQMIRFDEEVQNDISDSEADSLFTIITKQIQSKKFDAVIFEDYNKGVLIDSLIEVLMDLFSIKKIPVLVDPKKKNFFAYDGVTVFKPNLREAREALGKNFGISLKELNEAHNELTKNLSYKYTLITLGENGAYINDGTSGKIIPAQIRNVSDVSGAGDTVIAVMAAAIASGANAFDAALLSNLAGGIVCEKAGVVSIEKQRLLSELKEIQY